MRVKPLRTEVYLSGLAEFMNVAKPGVTGKQWRAFVQRMKKKKSTSPLNTYFTSCGVEWISLKEACEARTEIHSALDFMRNTRQDDEPFAPLVDALNDLKLVTQYQCLEVTGKAIPGAPILHACGKRWRVSWFPVTHTTKHLLYTILAGAFMDGALMRLKVCPQCKKYIAVDDTKRRFCSIQCHDDFHNRRRLAEKNRKKAEQSGKKWKDTIGLALEQKTLIKRLDSRPYGRWRIQNNLANRLKSATTLDAFWSGCDPKIKRTIENYLEDTGN